MQDSIALRLLWKEYRTQRGFWLAVTGIGVAIQILVYLFSATHDRQHPTVLLIAMIFPVLLIAMIFPVFYAVGCACSLFGAEEEEGTLQYLKVIASPPVPLFACKIAFFAMSSLLMLGVLGLVMGIIAFASSAMDPRILAPHLRPIFDRSSIFFSMFATQFLVFGILFSLFIRKVLVPVVATAVTSILCFLLLSRYLSPTGSIDLHWPPAWYWLAMGGVFVGDFWLVHRRLARPSSPWFSRGTHKHSTEGKSTLFARNEYHSAATRVFQRLIWQELRQSRGFLVTYALAAGALIVGTAVEYIFPLAILAVGFSPALFGLLAFHSEQRDRQFRFWSERGFSPAAVWASRQCFWLPLAIVSTAAFGFAVLQLTPSTFLRIGGNLTLTSFIENHPGSIALFVLYAYGIGQLMSMLIRRVLIAGFATYVVISLTVYWHVLTQGIDIPVWLSVTWILPVTLAATWGRTADWGRERNTWRARGKVVAMLGVPAFLVFMAISIFRVAEIPDRSAEFAKLLAENRVTIPAEAKETAKRYRAIAVTSFPRPWWKDEVKPHSWPEMPTDIKQWFEKNAPQLPALMAVTKRDECVMPTAPGGSKFGHDLHRLLFLSARKLESENKLDEAWSRYAAALRMARHLAQYEGSFEWYSGREEVRRIYDWILIWARHPQQTSARIVAAMKATDDEAARYPAFTRAYLLDRAQYAQMVESSPPLIRIITLSRPNDLDLDWVPSFWERARIKRLWAAMAVEQFERLPEIEKRLAQSTPVTSLVFYPSELSRFAETTIGFQRGWKGSMPQARVEEVITQRALRLRLALFAWRAEHGQFPEQLEQLVGKYLDKIPLDPWKGKPFSYYPRGKLIDVPAPNPTILDERPFLWIPGISGATIQQVHFPDNPPGYLVMKHDGSTESGHTNSPRTGYIFELMP